MCLRFSKLLHLLILKLILTDFEKKSSIKKRQWKLKIVPSYGTLKLKTPSCIQHELRIPPNGVIWNWKHIFLLVILTFQGQPFRGSVKIKWDITFFIRNLLKVSGNCLFLRKNCCLLILKMWFTLENVATVFREKMCNLKMKFRTLPKILRFYTIFFIVYFWCLYACKSFTYRTDIRLFKKYHTPPFRHFQAEFRLC